LKGSRRRSWGGCGSIWAWLDETEGFMMLVDDAEDGRLRGANAVGAHECGVLTPLVFGLRLGVGPDLLVALFPGWAGLSDLGLATARMEANGRPLC